MLTEGERVEEEVFLTKFCRIIEIGGFKRVSLKERENFDCIFWKETQGCSIYENRPVQCRTYPFWITFLEDEADWKNEAANCPGIGKGRIVGMSEIEERIAERQEESMLTV
jgi:Fe-S-cluster containining protein